MHTPSVDDFRDAVEAEIEVLLALWDEQSANPNPEGKPNHAKHRTNRGRSHSEAGQRLSRLVKQSPDTMRPVLATMKDALIRHAALHGLGEKAYDILLSRWRDCDQPAQTALFATALAQHGDRFFTTLAQELGHPSETQQIRALEAAQTAVALIDFCALGPEADPSLERRVSGSLNRDDLADPVMDDVAQCLAELATCQDTRRCDPAIAMLGSLHCTGHVQVVRDDLESAEPSTRLAAVMAIRILEDRTSLPRLQTMAGEDEPAVRRIALQSLGPHGATEARDLLVACLDEVAVRPHAICALGELGDARSRQEGGATRRRRPLRRDTDRAARFCLARGATGQGPWRRCQTLHAHLCRGRHSSSTGESPLSRGRDHPPDRRSLRRLLHDATRTGHGITRSHGARCRPLRTQ